MLNCFRNISGNSDQTGRTSPHATNLSEPYIRYHNEEGAQLFYNRGSKSVSYLNPTTLKEVQSDGKTGRDEVIQMKTKTGEIYGVDYGCTPEGRIVYMPLELKKVPDKNNNEEDLFWHVAAKGDLSEND